MNEHNVNPLAPIPGDRQYTLKHFNVLIPHIDLEFIEHDPAYGSKPVRFRLSSSDVEEYSVAGREYIGDVPTWNLESPLLWHYQEYQSIFPRAPLPDPPRFIVEYLQVLEQVGLKRDWTAYLHWPASLSEWLTRVYGRAYCLFTGPAKLVPLVTPLLEAQALEFQVLPDNQGGERKQLPREVLCFGKNWVVAGKFHCKSIPQDNELSA